MSKLSDLNTPVFAVEGILSINPCLHKLTVDGLENGNQTFSLTELKKNFPAKTVNMRLTSVSGWTVRANWDGISWYDFLCRVKPVTTSRYALFSSAEGIYSTCVLLNDLAASHAMLVWGVDNNPLEDKYGGPLRLVIPNLWGYKSCKWLTHISFSEKYLPGYWETRGYSHRGLIEPGETFDVNTQEIRQITGGEITDF